MEEDYDFLDFDYSGSYAHSIDEKGRVVIPSVFREEVEKGMIMTFNGPCVVLRPNELWETEKKRLAITAKQSAKAERRFRKIMAYKYDVALDRQGRLTIPSSHRKKLGLGDEVLVNGAGDRIEIWDPLTWDRYIAFDDEEDQALLMPIDDEDIEGEA